MVAYIFQRIESEITGKDAPPIPQPSAKPESQGEPLKKMETSFLSPLELQNPKPSEQKTTENKRKSFTQVLFQMMREEKELQTPMPQPHQKPHAQPQHQGGFETLFTNFQSDAQHSQSTTQDANILKKITKRRSLFDDPEKENEDQNLFTIPEDQIPECIKNSGTGPFEDELSDLMLPDQSQRRSKIFQPQHPNPFQAQPLLATANGGLFCNFAGSTQQIP